MNTLKIRTLGFTALFVSLSLAMPPFVCAESNPFFESNAARTVFGESAEVTVGGKIPESFKTGAAPKVAVLAPSERREPGVTVAQDLSADARAKIMSDFGDPTKDVPLRTIDNAPTPFKGMMAALDAGDESLAQQYAEQFQRYTEKLQRSNLTAVNLLGEVGRQKEMDAKAELVASGTRVGSFGSAKDVAALKQSAVGTGQEGRASLPVDPAGKVQVYFFFNTSDTKSGVAAREIEQLSNALRGDKRIQVVGVSADMMGNKAALDFKQRYELTFSVIADTPLANAMGVRSLPSVALVSPTTKQIILKDGVQPSAELKRLVRSMQGQVEGGERKV